jgi:hypothetical protein
MSVLEVDNIKKGDYCKIVLDRKHWTQKGLQKTVI